MVQPRRVPVPGGIPGPVIVLVCGSRDWTDRGLIEHHLIHLFYRGDPMTLVEGGAKGGDRLAGQWAARMRPRGVGWLRIPAAWSVHDREGSTPVSCRCPSDARTCKAAGLRRNDLMLEYLLNGRALGHVVGILAFSDHLATSRGTLDMVTRAEAQNVPVKRVSH